MADTDTESTSSMNEEREILQDKLERQCIFNLNLISFDEHVTESKKKKKR